MDFNTAKENFDKYINQFNMNNGNIRIKCYHTNMVVRLMEKLAKRMNLSKEEILLAKIIGLLHDIGRFKQIEKAQIIDDLKTNINHAELGCKYLFEEGHIRDFIEDDKYDELIKSAILNHSKLEIDRNLQDKELFFTKMIRDIDKIDILRVIATNDDYELIKEEVDDKVLKDFNNKKLINNKDIKSNSDETIRYLAYIYDIQFKESFELLDETDNLGLFISSLHIPKYSEEFASDCFKKVYKVLDENID